MAAYCVCAVAQGREFVRWLRSSEESKANQWPLFGWFAALGCLGSVTGALAYGFRIGQLDSLYNFNSFDAALTSSSTPSQLAELNSIRAVGRRYTAAHFAFFPFELAFVVLTQLIVLSRMQNFVMKSSRMEFWTKSRNLLLAVTVCLMVLGACGNLAAAFFYNQAAGISSNAATAYAANNSQTGSQLRSSANAQHSHAGSVASVQRFSEVIALLLIILAFFIAGFFGIRVVSIALNNLFAMGQRMVAINGVVGDQSRQLVASASDQGRKLQLKILVTTTFMFLALLLRSIFTIFYAVAQSLQNNGDPCAVSWCHPCKNMYSHMQAWILYTPSLQFMIMIVTSPGAILVALWGMTDVDVLEHMAAMSDISSCSVSTAQARATGSKSSDLSRPNSNSKVAKVVISNLLDISSEGNKTDRL